MRPTAAIGPASVRTVDLLLGEPMRLVGHQHISVVPILFTVLVGGLGLRHFATDGGMPQHGHGLPTKPQVTRELPDGGYLVAESGLGR